MVAPVPTTASAAGGDGAAAGASTSSPDLISTIASAQGAEEKAADPDPQSQSQPTLPVDLQTRAAPVGEGFQGLLSQPLHLVQSPPAATATAHAPGSVVDSPVGDHAWAQELGTRLAVMTARGEQSGSLKLNPEHLGPLEVQIRVKDTDVTVAFGAQHADTRTALNEALPRLREMFAQSGLQLTDAGVSRDGTRQALPSQPGRSLLASRTDAVSAIETALPLAVLRHTGMIDALA
jgi:flagellar hook-length control protein FliK